jgi:hypothetical protein
MNENQCVKDSERKTKMSESEVNERETFIHWCRFQNIAATSLLINSSLHIIFFSITLEEANEWLSHKEITFSSKSHKTNKS